MTLWLEHATLRSVLLLPLLYLLCNLKKSDLPLPRSNSPYQILDGILKIKENKTTA